MQLLARAKAEAVVGSRVDGRPIDGVMLGGDSVFELDGEIYGKPHTAEVARERWLAQRGRDGTAALRPLAHRPCAAAASAGPPVRSRPRPSPSQTTSSDAEIDAYVATGEPLAVAGAFTIDSLGAAFITRIEGDPHSVVGLSVSTVRSLLGDLGIPWTALWNRAL